MRSKAVKRIGIILISAIITVFGVTAFAADIKFEPEGGGKWIYCNNPEGLANKDLMNHPDCEPSYIMNNAHLTPDVYDFLMCHINCTDTDDGYGVGYDIELDVEMTASEDSVITVNKVFFETPQMRSYIYGDGTWAKEMHKVGCLNALASFLGVNLCERNGSWLYTAEEYEPVTVEIKKGETVWLSDYIKNYSVVPYRKPVEIMGEIEVEEGDISFNVAAFKSNGTLGDRTDFDPDAAYGKYSYTRTQKGIADTLPKVNANLEYTIDNKYQDGDLIENKVFNQYEKDGFVTDAWCTHLNPQDDIWSKKISTESDLLTFRYEDDSKLDYYGSKVKKDKRDNVWIWDPFHSDTTHYEGAVTWFEREDDYYPNYELSPYRSNQGYACSMGNYCVTESYNLKVKNTMPEDRYFEYVSQTVSNIVVYVEDEDGKHSGYVKGEWGGDVRDILASVRIPAKSEKEFTINVVLPINYVGGLKNSFMVSYEPHVDKTYEDYINEDNGIEDGVVTYGVTADAVYNELPDDVKKIVDGGAENFEITPAPWGYMLRYIDWDGIPYYYYDHWAKLKDMYMLDSDYNITGRYTPDFITRLALTYDGWYYREDADGRRFRTQDSTNWEEYNYRLPLPEITYNGDEPSKWAADEVSRAYEIDVAPYDLKDKLTYDEGMTRTIFCYVLSSMLERCGNMPENIDDDISFTDTESKTIRKLATAGIISGYDDGTFRPDNEITRQEAAVLLGKTYEYLFGASETDGKYEYADDEEIGGWSKPFVTLMHNTGIMQGVGENMFSPKTTYTNEQSIATIMRLYDLTVNPPEETDTDEIDETDISDGDTKADEDAETDGDTKIEENTEV